MPSLSDEVAVFVDTNMDTHIALSVSPAISVAEFKRELERMHARCFAKLGDIKVHDLMVKRKGCFYHLPESLPLRCAFQGLKGNWFLFVVVRASDSLDKHGLSQCLTAKDGIDSVIADADSSELLCTDPEKQKKEASSGKPSAVILSKDVPNRQKRRAKTKQGSSTLACRANDLDKECPGRIEETSGIDSGGSAGFQMYRNEESLVASSSIPRTPNERSSLVASRSIPRTPNERSYVKNDNSSDIGDCAMHHFAASTPPRPFPSLLPTDLLSAGVGNRLYGTASMRGERNYTVGERIMVAKSNIIISGNKYSPSFSFRRSRRGSSASNVLQSSVFEISDSD
ncbi:hypothetical protein Tsubulata_043157 [Turnera subulata]|uniref:Uncharacterized protein n=1 Tax=Turnera subulata TaxID=218843 RepID=A0A9Q0FZ60_9ROSI|nr:hypothetical protein Tsubulata_043157 [Turnera subulata]